MKVELSREEKKTVGKLSRLKVLSRMGWVAFVTGFAALVLFVGTFGDLEFTSIDMVHILRLIISGAVIFGCVWLENYVSEKKKELNADLKEM